MRRNELFHSTSSWLRGLDVDYFQGSKPLATHLPWVLCNCFRNGYVMVIMDPMQMRFVLPKSCLRLRTEGALPHLICIKTMNIQGRNWHDRLTLRLGHSGTVSNRLSDSTPRMIALQQFLLYSWWWVMISTVFWQIVGAVMQNAFYPASYQFYPYMLETIALIHLVQIGGVFCSFRHRGVFIARATFNSRRLVHTTA